jgi:hypothetical protein
MVVVHGEALVETRGLENVIDADRDVGLLTVVEQLQRGVSRPANIDREPVSNVGADR